MGADGLITVEGHRRTGVRSRHDRNIARLVHSWVSILRGSCQLREAIKRRNAGKEALGEIVRSYNVSR